MNGELIDNNGRDDVSLKSAQSLPPGLMLLKMENESMMSVARTTPRDPMAIVRQLKELIEAYPAAADDAIYSKPVGTVQRVECGKCGIFYEVQKVDQDTSCPACESKQRGAVRAVKKFAEGLSIRAAESIRSIFGCTRLTTTTEIMPDGTARITGTLVDYAACNMTSDERIVSPFYKSREGTMIRTPEDRFNNVVIKAEKSKLKRDVILDSTPGIIKAMFRDMCEQKLEALIAPELIEQKIIPEFQKYGISHENLDKIIGKPISMGWTEEERLLCRKILTALKNEETTVRELLADIAPKDDGPKNVSRSELNDQIDSAAKAKPKDAPKEESKPKAETKKKSEPKEEPKQVDEPAPDTEGAGAALGEKEQAMLDEYKQMLGSTKTKGDVTKLLDYWKSEACQLPPSLVPTFESLAEKRYAELKPAK